MSWQSARPGTPHKPTQRHRWMLSHLHFLFLFSFFSCSLTHSLSHHPPLTLLPLPCLPVPDYLFSFFFFSIVCVYICKVCIAVMNLGKWMSWRKRNFFRRKGKHESSLDLGKLVLINLKSRLNTPALILFFIAEGAQLWTLPMTLINWWILFLFLFVIFIQLLSFCHI